MTKRNSFSKVLSLPLLLALLVLVSMVWIQASVSPAAAQEPVQDLSEIGMRIEIVPEEIHNQAIVDRESLRDGVKVVREASPASPAWRASTVAVLR